MGKAHASVRITINRPLAEVFEYMADYNRNINWQEGVTRCEVLTPGGPGVGAEIAYTRELLGRSMETRSKMVDYAENERIRIATSGKLFSYMGGYDFEASSGGTLVKYDGEISTSRLLGPAGKLIAANFERQMSKDLQNLKRLLES